MKNLPLYIITATLVIAGTALFLFKLLVLHFPIRPDATSSSYTVDARLFFSARSDKSIKARLLLPTTSNRYVIVDESFVSRGYGLSMEPREDNRAAVWAIRRATGDQYLFYRAVVQKIKSPEPEITGEPPRIERPVLSGTQLVAAQTLLADVRQRSADLESLLTELVKELDTNKSKGAVGLLLEGNYSLLKKAQIAATVLLLAELPARVVHGLELKDLQRDAELIHWVEVFDGSSWRAFVIDADNLNLPDNYFVWWRGNLSLYYAKNGQNVHVSFDLKRNEEAGVSAAISEARVKHPFMYQFSLFNLPVDVQGVYRILLVLPLGALIAVLFRNVIGLQTFGTFMPILIALSFRETKLLWGCILLVSIVFAGMATRLALERLKLLLIPRLSAVLTIVVLLMALLSVLSHNLGIDRGLSVALFPIVIITMVIERMAIVWEELGAGESIKQGIGSLVVAIAAYLFMREAVVRHVLFVFPELNLIILAVILLLGRYTGYRLTELRRFRMLAQQDR